MNLPTSSLSRKLFTVKNSLIKLTKLNLVPRLCPPHCFTPIKSCNGTPIVHFPAEEKPNRISDSGPFNNYDYTDPFIDDSKEKDGVFIDDKNNIRPVNEETKAEADNLFEEIFRRIKTKTYKNYYKKISHVSNIECFMIVKLVIHLDILEI